MVDNDIQVVTVLKGHVSPDTAYVVSDYPYGYTLRTTIRYWLDFHKTRGTRLVSQTINPKNGRWNKEKASTYCRFGGCMYLDEKGHVQWAGLTEYSDYAEAKKWSEEFSDGVPGQEALKLLDQWVAAKKVYEEKIRPKLFPDLPPKTV